MIAGVYWFPRRIQFQCALTDYVLPKGKTYITGDSHVVPHRSTEQAQGCLTSEFGWDPVLSPWYERMMRVDPGCGTGGGATTGAIAQLNVDESSRISTAFIKYDLRGAAARPEIDEISRISTDLMTYDLRGTAATRGGCFYSRLVKPLTLAD